MNNLLGNDLSPIRWDGNRFYLLDQRLLPSEEKWLSYDHYVDVAGAITDMVVRGAPAIGVTAAFGMFLGAREKVDPDRVSEVLSASRPTAVNLVWAVKRMREVWEKNAGDISSLENEAIHIFHEDVRANQSIGSHGRDLLGSPRTIMTICNAGALATAGYGTALGVIRAIHEASPGVRVVVPETRPYLQGARITAWELVHDQIPATLITDNMVGWWMKKEGVDAVVVGADRIAANGDTANKIGTYQMALLAREHGVPFCVAAPYSTIDLSLPGGEEIPIEERDPVEVKEFRGEKIAPEAVSAWHPAFDVTPHHLIAAIITERGVVKEPFIENIRANI